MTMDQLSQKKRWINSTGGPLILIERNAAQDWKGVVGVDMGGQTDYERACSIDDYVGLIFAEKFPVLVLNQEPLITTWLGNDNLPAVIVRCVWANSLIEAENTFEEIPTLGGWVSSGVSIEFATGHLVIFDSSENGSVVSDRIDAMVGPGKYFVDTLIHEPHAELKLLLHRLRRS